MSRKKRDRVDGYTPPEQQPQKDPWKDPALEEQMEKRANLGRMDAAAFDSFKNELTGIGDWTRDKTFGGRQGGLEMVFNLLNSYECEARWRGSDLGGRMIETIPDEMTREGWELALQPSTETAKRVDAERAAATAQVDAARFKALDFLPGGPPEPAAPKGPPPPLPDSDDEIAAYKEGLEGQLEDLGAINSFDAALKYERGYGGSAILIGADDGLPLDQPLDEDRIKSIRYLNTFTGGWDGEIVAWSYYRDPASPKYGQPEVYMLRNIGVPIASVPTPGTKATPEKGATYGSTIWWVHESRLLIFPGQAVSPRARVEMRGWGDSVFVRADRVLQQFDQTWGGVAALMQEFSSSILAIDGLADSMASNNKRPLMNLTTRARAFALGRTIAGVTLIDAKEKFSRDTVSIAGVEGVLGQFLLRLAAACDMPVSLLTGQVKGGLGDAGNTDVRFFYDRVASKQNRILRPRILRLVSLLMKAKDGPTAGQTPARWTVRFNPLFQLTEAEQATLRKTVAETDQIYYNINVLSESEIAASVYGGSEWSMERTIDLEGRKKFAAAQEAEKEAEAQKLVEEAKAAANQPPAPPPPAGAPPKEAEPQKPAPSEGDQPLPDKDKPAE